MKTTILPLILPLLASCTVVYPTAEGPAFGNLGADIGSVNMTKTSVTMTDIKASKPFETAVKGAVTYGVASIYGEVTKNADKLDAKKAANTNAANVANNKTSAGVTKALDANAAKVKIKRIDADVIKSTLPTE